jgi:hypothetical protein
MIAAYDPDRIDDYIADKQRQLDHDDVVRLYRMLGDALDWSEGDDRVVELVDLLERMIVRDVQERGADLGADAFDDPFVDLLDTTVVKTSPIAGRIMALLEERGWKGWTRLEEVPPEWRSGLGRAGASGFPTGTS